MDFGVDSSSGGATTAAVKVVPDFGGYQEPFWHVTKLHLKHGKDWSIIHIEAPTVGWGGDAPLMTGIQGPLLNCKGGSRVKAFLNGVLIFNGSLGTSDENFDVDGAVLEAFDDRYLLEGVIIKGSHWRGDDGIVVYRESEPCWFNPGGLPNRIGGDAGLTYCFCDPMQGLRDSDATPDPTTNSQTSANYWTPDSMWCYIVQSRTKAIAQRYIDNATSMPEYTFIPSSVEISDIESDFFNFFNASAETVPIGLRIGEECIVENTPMNLALQKFCEMAGPFSLNMEYKEGDISTLTIVQSRFLGEGKSLRRPNNPNIPLFGEVTGGGIKKDFSQFFTQVAGSSDRQYLETRVASTSKKTIAAQIAEGVELISAWDPAIEAAIIKEFNDGIDALTNPVLSEIISKRPLVFEAWRLNPNKNFHLGTNLGSIPWCKTTNRRILPHMLTRLIANPNGTNPYELKTQFYPYWFEVGEEAVAYTPSGNGTAQAAGDGGNNGNTPPGSGDSKSFADYYADAVAAFAAADPGAGMPENDGAGSVEGDQTGGNAEA